MDSSQTRWWFKRKKQGLGWALLSTWQGWLLSLAYVGLLVLGWRVAGEDRTVALTAYVAAVTAGALGVCLWRGEPSVWRGQKPDERTGVR